MTDADDLCKGEKYDLMPVGHKRLLVILVVGFFCVCVFKAVIHPSRGGVVINVLNSIAVSKPSNCPPQSNVNFSQMVQKRAASPKPESGFLVPNIVHYIWFTKSPTELKFFHMLSLLSAEKYLKPTAIYFHTNHEPIGEYWDEVKRKLTTLKVVPRQPTTCLFNEPITNPVYDTSQSDLDRLAILMEHGGIYLDMDVLVIKSFDPLRKYPCTIGLENPQRVCGGIIVCAADSVFLNLWIEHFLFDYKMWTWAYMSGIVPRKIAAHYPGLIHLEEEYLQTPNGDEIDKIWGNEQFDWTKHYALHLLWRVWKTKALFMVNEPDEAFIKKDNSSFSQIARRILHT
ncbi:hypothetical protein CAPTEDRAFT_196653 [Capitella teleta]|uniref:Alpha-1,4-N-acetylglucosaminyltransferase n=1 Tax=Capitella teleta TaxID=283909 RepID=R7TZB2_CAPTE|nr:hypothetical protein CAPTEDRAFT_196653 [Capitella teleta]|eukprot:ELT96741.1 hypothetical protein CAPTEDRAFT_196653 [Capitella teleta]